MRATRRRRQQVAAAALAGVDEQRNAMDGRGGRTDTERGRGMNNTTGAGVAARRWRLGGRREGGKISERDYVTVRLTD